MEKLDSVESTLWEFRGLAQYTDKKFLMSNPFPVVFVLVAYLWFVLKFGPEFMKNRKPFKLDRVLPVYNLVQVLASCYILGLGLRVVPMKEILHVGWNHPKCYSEMRYEQLSDGTHCYFLAKLMELLDTVFFVLRKKQSQVTFLHVYHHTIMVFCTWCVVKYSAVDSIIVVGFLNTLVHVIMYSYYGLSVFPSMTKYLWWKKYITMFQLVQFFLMFVNVITTHFVSECQKSYVLLFAVSSNAVLFLYLFSDFFIKAYTKKAINNIKNNTATSSAIDVSSNGEANKGLNYLMNHHKLAAKIN